MQKKSLIFISFLLVVATILTACGTPAYAQTEPTTKPPCTVNVTGEGKIYLTPDIAYISIGVHTEDKDAAKAVSSNNTQSQKVSEALKTFKIDAKDIQTTNFSIFPQQQYDQNGKLQGILYVVDNTVYVTLRDLTKVGELLDSVVKAGANSINGIQFDLADKSKALSEARKAAVTDAAAQAKELAEAAGVTLGPIQSISIYGTTPTPIYEGKGGGGVMAAVQAPISPGQMTIVVDVNVVYEIQ
jgi:uncharacterized protein YggE